MPQGSPSGKDANDDKFLLDRAEALKLYNTVLNSCNFAVVAATSEGTITGFNPAAESLFRTAADEVISKLTLTDLIYPGGNENRQSSSPVDGLNSIIKRLNEAGTCQFDSEFIRRDGTHFAGSLTVVAVRDSQNNITSIACVIADMSQNVVLHKRLDSPEDNFRLLAEHVPGAIYLCLNDEHYTTVYINNQIQTITGYPKEDFLNGKRTFAQLFHPNDAPSIRETIDKCVARRTRFRIRYRLRHISGDWRWVDETGTGIYEDGELKMLQGFILDITEQKNAEIRLLQMAAENLRFFNNPVNLNAVGNFDGILQRISPSWTQMLGWTETELKSTSIYDFIHPEDLEGLKKEMSGVFESTSVHTVENRMMCKDGSYRWLLWALASDPVEKLIYASAIDISERKRSEKTILDSKSNLESLTLQLQEQNKRLDEFAHIISHNLRSPVNNIQALINLLNENSEINDYKLIYDKLKNVAKNLSETMNELMDTLKVKTQAHVNLTEIRFKEVLDKVVQSLEGELIVAHASVTFDFNEAPSIRYSKPYLESIFQNLLTNAVKYKSPNRKPSIHFRSFMDSGRLTLQVRDNGQGIDMEKFGDKLFGLHKTFHNHREARGVGLFLVKTQIEALGGTISAESGVDKGTVFTIRFN